MTPWKQVEADRRARHEAGKQHYRPDGGEFVVNHPDGLMGEAYDETLDAINYLKRLTATRNNQHIQSAICYVESAACILLTEIAVCRESAREVE